MRVPLLDLTAQYRSIQDEIDEAVLGVMRGGAFILGQNVRAFEEETARYLGVRHAVGVASGTDALLLSLRAIGVSAGDEVIVPDFTFYATAEVVMLLGATPRLVDIDPQTYCLDVEQLEEAVGPRTKAIIPVHLFGHPADMDGVTEIAERHGLTVIEDNAQAIGAEHRGRKTGGLGRIGCLSFYPTKNLGAYGDGGMVVTNDASIAEKVAQLRAHGWSQKHKHVPEVVGYNSRLDELQAAILRVKLKRLEAWSQKRRELASAYSAALAGLSIRLPVEAEHARSAYHLYVVEVDGRERVVRELAAAGVGTGVYYPYPLHLVPALKGLGHAAGDFPASERASERCLALPLYPEMTTEQLEHVVEAVANAVSAKLPT
ncbi:MAG: DegT/DnrJ/EryC1/StrS family aminotransferase [Chloroflexi bacterium]|nr:DegT/DnrJ/EryC1/StrS family aminotransferase [Chloroflexota bacterium]